MLFAFYCTSASSVPQAHFPQSQHTKYHTRKHLLMSTTPAPLPFNILPQYMNLSRWRKIKTYFSPACIKLSRRSRQWDCLIRSNNKYMNIPFSHTASENRLLTDGAAGNRLRETVEGLIGFWWSSPTDATMLGSHGTISVFFHNGCLPLIPMDTHLCAYKHTDWPLYISQSPSGLMIQN